MTGWRLGYGIFPRNIFDYAEKLAINCHSCVNSASQFAGIEALKGSQKEVDQMIKVFQERRNFLVSELNKLKMLIAKFQEELFMFFQKFLKII